jgi:hypothetical protein
MKTQYTYRQTQDAFIDYIKAYYDQYRYMFKETNEKVLLKIITQMFSQFCGGNAKIEYLHAFQRNIENEINKGYDLLKSINAVFHK